MRIFTLITLAMLAFTGCNTGIFEFVRQKQQVDDSVESAVYHSVLKKYYGNKTQAIVVRQLTYVDDVPASNKKMVKQLLEFANKNMGSHLMQETLNDFRLKNEQPISFTNCFDTSFDCVFISRDQEVELGKDGNYWEEFFKKYRSAGLVTFSRIGFNPEKTQALLYIGRSYGLKNGSGDYLLLIKENGFWSVKQEVNIWVS